MTTTAAVNSSTTTTGTTNTNTGTSTTTDKTEFLKILAAEMQYQDPSNPTSNTEFVAQLAQFNSLEQLQTIAESFSASNLMQSAGLVGKTVAAQLSDGTNIEGKVESILVKDSIPYAVIGEKSLPVSSITQIS